MKKISLFGLALTASLVMFAQNYEKPTPMAVKTRFGIKAGVNLAELMTKGYPSGFEPGTQMKTSMHGGFFVNVPVGTGGLAVQPEILYSGAGSKITSTSGGLNPTTQNYEQDLRYIAVPVMLQWKSTGGIMVELGPQAAYLIQAKQDGPGETKTDNKSSFDKFDFSAGAGIGYLSRIGLGIGARYNWGFRNILDDGGNSNNTAKLKNQVINIGLSWYFGAGK
jgi:hypothetical protein